MQLSERNIQVARPLTERPHPARRRLGAIFRSIPSDKTTPQPTPPPTLGSAFASRDNNLVALRLLLAITVVYSHCYPLSLGHGQGDPLSKLTSAGSGVGATAGLTTGYFAVCAFFVLSGFVITHSFSRAASIRDFLVNRARRLYPPFLLAGAICFLLAPLATAASPLALLRQLPGYALDVLTLRAFHLDGLFVDNPFAGALNGSLWSMKYEVVCYALIVLLGTLGLFRRPRLVVGLFLVATALYAAQVTGLLASMGITLWWPRRVAWLLGEIDHWPRVLTYHLAGMSLYLYRHRLPRSGWLASAGIGALVVIGIFSPTAVYFMMPMLVGYAALYIGFGTFARSFTRQFDKLDLSYGIYLYAFPIQQLLVMWVPETRSDPLMLFAMTMPIVVAFALLSRRLLAGFSQKTKTRSADSPSQPTPQPSRLAA